MPRLIYTFFKLSIPIQKKIEWQFKIFNPVFHRPRASLAQDIFHPGYQSPMKYGFMFALYDMQSQVYGFETG